MAVRVRLTRVGSKKNAMWRVVVADQRSPRDGRFIEMIGHYNPQTEPSQIVIDRERLDHWISRGAEPSDTVRKLMRAPNSEAPLATPPAPAAEEAPAPAPDTEEEAAPESEAAPDAEKSEEDPAAAEADADSGDAAPEPDGDSA